MSLVAYECLPSPSLEPEPCSRARSQARVYLEQIRNRVALGAPDIPKRDYLVDAATQIRLALERDVGEDYEAAFNHYQNGVDVLLRGIHVDPNKERREAVKLKITKYLRRAEEIFNCHLQRPLGSGASPSTVQLVQDPATRETFVVKSLPRCHMVSRERLTIIPHGVPYMTKLLRYFVSEDSIFLHLEHVQGGTLWSHLLSQAHPRHSGLSSGSTQERMKAQLNPHLNLLTPARLPSGHTPGQDRIALEPPRTSPSLPLAGEAPSTRPQREAEGEPTARTSTSGSSDLPKAPGGHLHLQARRAGQNSDAGPPQGLTWVPEGAGLVLGGCGQGMDQSCLSADGAGRGCGRATWSVREEQVKQWAAETLVALEALHEQGVLCRDLHPGNLLLDQAGHIRLTYFGQWSEVEPQCCGEAVDNLYSAPEVGGISELTEACDWWSFGSLLYELLTGMALSQSHPSGIQAHTQLQLPEWLSRPAASLLTELLQFEPTRRLGVGEGGVSKLKSHPFFSTIQWSKLVGTSLETHLRTLIHWLSGPKPDCPG
ncbi:PREDICTED: ribosomal protein S6 kinase-like 1 isoform X4 [Rhinopithecus bieti]|uniref:ribosomal protein S6 kinase-like 1 isoform X4 n=1 Tax=Rhinopithecus bieti TaxID=61621 RepID=UPI00083BAF87|nr:PREDICTED: ribosomal protein S6 kinase-like 1 isoform X4 [Rhinopithecus bieti]